MSGIKNVYKGDIVLVFRPDDEAERARNPLWLISMDFSDGWPGIVYEDFDEKFPRVYSLNCRDVDDSGDAWWCYARGWCEVLLPVERQPPLVRAMVSEFLQQLNPPVIAGWEENMRPVLLALLDLLKDMGLVGDEPAVRKV